METNPQYYLIHKEWAAVVAHEMGHAMSLEHEHQRSDCKPSSSL
jgi:predicted Zn-dependent protease